MESAAWAAAPPPPETVIGDTSARTTGVSASAPDAEPARSLDDESDPPELVDDPAARAQYWFARGNEHAFAGRHAAAARAFARSAEAFPTREAYYNEALAHELAGEPELAIVAFESYLALDLTERGPPPDAADVRVRLTRLEALVGWVVVRVSSDEGIVDLRVDDVPLDPRLRTDVREAGGDMIMSLHLRAGLHRLRFERGDGTTLERVVDVSGGERHELRLVADVPADATGQGTTTGTADEEGRATEGGGARDEGEAAASRRGRRIARDLAITSGAVTGTSLALTVTFAGLTLDAKRDFEAGLCDGPCTNGESYPYDDERRFERNRTATNVLAGVTAGLAAVTVIVATLAAREPGRDRERSRRRSLAAGAPWQRVRHAASFTNRRGASGFAVVVDVGEGLRVRF